MPKHSDPLDACFQALSDSTRRAVIARLAGGPLPASTLAEPFGMAMPSFLQHLSVLEDAGLIVTEKVGRVRLCRVPPGATAAAEDWLSRQRRRLEAETGRLQDFLDSGRDLDA